MTPAKQRFGSRLTAERESREITLEQVSAFTKIPVPLLEALERGDLSRWPKGFYRRALFRTYVTALGLEPEPLASEFARVFSDESSSEPDVNVPVAASPHANASSEQLASISTSAPAVDGVWRAGITALVEVAAVIAVGGIVSLAADMTLLMGTGVIALIYYPAMRAATERIRRSSGGAAAQRPTLLRARPSFTTLTDISEIGSATGHQRVAYGIGSRLASASRSWATLHAHCTRSSRPMARMFGQSRRTLRHSAEATYRVSARTIGWARLSLRHCGKASRRTFGYTRRLLWHGARATGQVSSGIVSRTTSFLRHAAAAWIQTFR
jgi:transcriptional regulator with XRE-family HTH domain